MHDVTDRKKRNTNCRLLFILVSILILTLACSVSAMADDPKGVIKEPANNKEFELGKTITVKATLSPVLIPFLSSEKHSIYFRVMKGTQSILYDAAEWKTGSSVNPPSKTFTPETEGEYLISVCYHKGASALDENDFEADDSVTVKVLRDLSKSGAEITGLTDLEYTGSGQFPVPAVRIGDQTLNPDTDYDLSYQNNVNVGTATVTATGKGFYKGSVSGTFRITRADFTKVSVGNIPDVDYTGDRHMPSPSVTANGLELVPGTDYTLSWGENVNAGTATVSFEGKGNFTGNVEKTFRIRQVSMVYTEITNIRDYVYNGNPHYQSPIIYYAGKRLVGDKDYTLSYRNNVQLGTAAVIITGKGNFKDSVTRTFCIEDFYLSPSSDSAILTFNEQQIYSENFNVNEKILISAIVKVSSPLNPMHYLYIRVKKNGRTVKYDYKYFEEVSATQLYMVTDFTPTESGDYLIELDYSEEYQPESNFFRDATKILNIGNTRADISRASVTGFTDKEYTGNAITQSLTVTLGGKTLAEGTDYYVNYYTNTDVGQASFKVHGIGNYRGTVAQETAFSITPKNLSSDMITLSPDGFTYDGFLHKPDVSVSNGDFILREGTDYTVTANTGGTEPGSYSVTVSSAANGNYAGSASKSYSVSGISIAGARVSVSPSTFTYDGTEKRPEVTVTLNGSVFPADKYTVKYSSNINAGTASVTVTAADSHFTGSAQTTFSIGKLDISSNGITVAAPADVIYNRSAHTPVPGIARNGKNLVNNTDYKLSYAANVNAGTAVVTIAGNGNYSGSRTASFTIFRKNITDASVTFDDIPDQLLTEGSPVTPLVTVKDGTAVLTSDEIMLTYQNNNKEGIASVTITGIGNYTGTGNISFRIFTKATETTQTTETESAAENLLEEIARLEQTDTSQYTKEDQKAIQTAISDAKAVLGNSSASAGEKAKAIKNLETVKKTADDNLTATLAGTKINETAVPAAKAQEKTILSLKSDSDPKGSTYGPLQARMKKVTKTSVTLQWKKIKGARYTVYGNKCGKKNKYRKIKTVTGTSFTQKKLKKGTYYKYLIVAVKDGKAVATSKTIHAATAGGKVGNAKSVKVSKKTLKVKAGKTARITAAEKPANRKLKVKSHRKIAFESSNTNIAAVSGKGVVKGVRSGTCYVYAYAQNGVMAKVKIRVS